VHLHHQDRASCTNRGWVSSPGLLNRTTVH
jgi:hypothetical protein